MAKFQEPLISMSQVQRRADAVRSCLIDTFSLIEHLQGLSQAVPRHNLHEFFDPQLQRRLLQGDHHQLVRFTIKPVHSTFITNAKRQQCRLKLRCSKWPPLSLWADWILNLSLFQNFIIFFIILNTIVLMAETELTDMDDPNLETVMLTLEVLAWYSLLIFLLEFAFMWMSNFYAFWMNAWNIFDFVVTMLSLVPEIGLLMGLKGDMMWLQALRISRVLRSLKLFARFRQSMTYLLVLVLLFFYVFSVAGVYFFEAYSRSSQKDLEYNMFFMDLPNSFVTVFILFTMDHWYAILLDAWKVPEINRTFSSLYVILWLLLGSIIFRNIIVAMMVTNFQAIRNELNEEVTHLEVQQKADQFKRQIIRRRQAQRPKSVRERKFSSRSNLQSKIWLQGTSESSDSQENPLNLSRSMESSEPADWENHVHQNLPGLMEMDQDERVVWPRDSLFRYFELLEKLQFNLDERKKLQDYAVLALMNLDDK
ncbi:cation channel sperm-associated protein 2 isoform X2 [Ornithorhynchus anatinus]|uniref:cation channel sperm-associated protein 2 isoform X2 n=1 Tax=Ornithorhynchus anatinus TaxID=9258 RepID=UPI0019D42BC6|nr:cation channel sperm-associated protein 2 isoform X2 [Ornithorhynchus anatinus]